MIDEIRHLIEMHARLPISAEALKDGDDLHKAGMSSFASVQLMLAIEEQFDVEYPIDLMTRHYFSSVTTIAECVRRLSLVPAD